MDLALPKYSVALIQNAPIWAVWLVLGLGLGFGLLTGLLIGLCVMKRQDKPKLSTKCKLCDHAFESPEHRLHLTNVQRHEMLGNTAFRKAFESGSLGMDVLNYMLPPFTQSTAQTLINLVKPNLYVMQQQALQNPSSPQLTEKEKRLIERVTPSTRWPNLKISVGELRDLLTDIALDYRMRRGWVTRKIVGAAVRNPYHRSNGWDEEDLSDIDIGIKVTTALMTVIQANDRNAIIDLITA